MEILPEKYPINENSDEQYAYVTFVDSISAFRALEDEFLKQVIKPADTWKQPDYIDKFKNKNYLAENAEISLNQLNEYCLLEIFNYMDLPTLIKLSRICSRFANIITHRIFPKFKSVDFDFTNLRNRDVSKQVTVASMRETLLSIGAHLTHAQLRGPQLNTTRIMNIFTKNIGANIERLELWNIDITQRMYLQLQPIFSFTKQSKFNMFKTYWS